MLVDFSEQDLAILKQMAHEYRSGRKNTESRPPTEHTWSEGEDHQAPETYVAKPQTSAGIPKLLPTDDTTGTGTDISGSLYDEPGKAVCDIAKIVYNSVTGDSELLDVGLPVEVHNLSSSDISQDWILVTRTKYGKWIAAGSGAGTGEEIEVVTDYRVSGLVLQKKTRTVKVITVGDESAWTDVHTGVDCSETGTGS